MAIKHGLATLYSSHSDVHIKLLVDNMTAVAYINNMGELTLSYVITQPEKFGIGALKGIYGSQHVIFQGFKTT